MPTLPVTVALPKALAPTSSSPVQGLLDSSSKTDTAVDDGALVVTENVWQLFVSDGS
jgi:hypothetical protein